jgi:outer membrane protein OmpA-like peptidoglycan-associated protein
MKKSILNLFIVVFVLITISSNLKAQNTGNFGTKEMGLINLKGALHFFCDTVQEYSQVIENQKPEGFIYTKELNVPNRQFTEGFPGVTDRFEYFGLIYKCMFEIPKPGLYKWRLTSDDGSILWIDNKIVVNNDGVHGENSTEGEVELTNGNHSMKVWFFQGPATELGLQLFVTPPDAEEKIFTLDDYSANLSKAVKNIKAIATSEGIRVKLPNSILFDVAKFDLKSTALSAIQDLAEVIRAYPGCTVIVEGHTDNTGKADENKILSENRAKSVKEALSKQNPPQDSKLQTIGYGSSKPAASNQTEDGKAQNRRVEVLIVP